MRASGRVIFGSLAQGSAAISRAVTFPVRACAPAAILPGRRRPGSAPPWAGVPAGP